MAKVTLRTAFGRYAFFCDLSDEEAITRAATAIGDGFQPGIATMRELKEDPHQQRVLLTLDGDGGRER